MSHATNWRPGDPTEINAEFVRHMLDYEPSSGVLTWREKPAPRVNIGSRAGYVKANGYVGIKMGGRLLFAHRLAWLHFYGEWPAKQIDHINRKRDDNRILNLREVTPRENHANRSDNASGVPGVCWSKSHRKYQARIWVRTREIHLGFFDDLQLAADVRHKALNQLAAGILA